MASIFKRKDSSFWWVSYVDGGREIRRSLKVTSKKAAEILLAECLLIETKNHNPKSRSIVLKKNIATLWDEFVLNRSTRAKTKTWFFYAKKNFVAFCEERGIKNIDDITMGSVEDFYRSRQTRIINVSTGEKKETPSAARSNFRALRAFLNYAKARGFIQTNPAANIAVVKPTKKIFRSLTSEEILRFLDAAKKHGPHYYPLLATAFYAGLRAGELLYLEPSDINFRESVISIRSKPGNLIKDNQERRVPMNSKLKEEGPE